MIRLWQWFIHGCWHDWRYRGSGPLLYGDKPAGQYYTYQCSRCERIEERGKGL